MTAAPDWPARIEELEAENQELRLRLKDLESLIEFLPVGIGVAHDAECRDIRINQEFARLLKVDADRNASKSGPEASRLPFHVKRDGREIAPQEMPMQMAARDRRPYRDIELDIVRDDGTTIRELCFAQPLFNEQGDVAGSIGAFLDITDRRRVEEALRASEERYRFLAEAIPQVVWVSTLENQILYINSHWHAYTGIMAEETRAGAWEEAIHADDRQYVLARAHSGLAEGNYEAEYRLRRATDGAYRWHLGRAKVVTMGDGTRRWLGTAIDIHDRKRTEAQLTAALGRELAHRVEAERSLAELRRTEDQLLLLVEASSALMVTPDSGLVLTRIMDLAKRFVGADAYAVWRRVDGGTLWSTIADYGLSAAYKRTATEVKPAITVLASEPLAIENVMDHPAVEQRRSFYEQEAICSLLAVPLTIHGRLEGTICFYYRTAHHFNDLEIRVAGGLSNLAAAALGNAELYEKQTELRRQAEVAERRANFLAEAGRVLSSSLDVEATLSSVVSLAVPAFSDWAALDILEDSGELRRVAVRHSDPAKLRFAEEYVRKYPPSDNPGLMRAVRTGTSVLVKEIPADAFEQVRDAEHRQLLRHLGLNSIVIAPLVSAGNVLGVWTFVTAESGKRFQESDLMLAEELASRAATAIVHARLYREQKQIQAALERANSELKRSNEDVNQFAYSASHDLKEPLRMIAIYSQLLEAHYGRTLEPQARTFLDYVVRGARRMDMLIRDILAYTQTAGDLADTPAHASGAGALNQAVENLQASIRETEAEISAGPLPELRVQEVHLVQIFQNLLSNAIKYRSSAAPRISVTAEKLDGKWKISVEDNGIGIAPQFSRQIFGIFTRLHPAERYSGTGIGLAICLKIVERYEGEIGVDSEEGKGATFWFTLPGA